ncbi:hypothetical protein RB595_008223 [Gaeumannomyces hyphopodioides]
MAPIRIALAGLSSSAKTAWAASAHLPYLLSERGRARYEIVALLNSSEDAARAAVAAYNLPASTRAYGSAAALAADGDVELVVVCTRVDNHHANALDSLRAGKDVYVEWPLSRDVAHSRELLAAAAEGGGRTMVGIQGRVAPPVLKVRELLRQGRIGKVLSSEVMAHGGLNSRDTVPANLKYFTDKTIGGNIYTIGFGHLFDQVNSVLGHMENPQAQLQIQRPQVKILDTADRTGQAVGTATTNVPDLIVVTGRVAPGPSGVDVDAGGATVLHRFRLGAPFPGEVPLRWTVGGERGEVRLTARAGTTLHAFAYDTADPAGREGVSIEVHDFATDSVEQVDWAWAGWQEELPLLARSVAELYERFADGRDVPTFADALRSQEQLEELLVRGRGLE